jgi:hypothetical protein
VAGFEDIARRLTENGRVPGMAMAIVHDGHVLSARLWRHRRQPS